MFGIGRAAVAALGLAALSAGCIEDKAAPRNAPPGRQGAGRSQGPAAAPITLKQFRAVDISLQYPEVVELFGRDGVLTGSAIRGGRGYETYRWENADGSAVVIRFEDGRVQHTEQRGLR